MDIIAQIIAARNYVSYYQNHIWIIASYYETLCIIALIIAPRAIMDLAPIIAKSIIALIIRIIALIIVCAIMRAII